MSDHLDRVEQELVELTGKVNRLSAFLNRESLSIVLTDKQRKLMDMQLNSMISYETCLKMRLVDAGRRTMDLLDDAPS